MKKKVVLAVAAALTAVLLAGCADSESQNTAGAGQAGTTQSGTGTAQSTQPGAAQSAQAGSDQSTGQSAGQSADQSTQTAAEQTADQATVPAADNSGVEADATFDAQNQNGPDDDASTSEDDQTDPWIGTFKKLDGEVLVITAADNSTVTFSFQNSGIAAMAEATSPYQAVYSGDDNMKVTFDLSDTTGDVTVSVADADGNAVTDTPLAGEFTKQ